MIKNIRGSGDKEETWIASDTTDYWVGNVHPISTLQGMKVPTDITDRSTFLLNQFNQLPPMMISKKSIHSEVSIINMNVTLPIINDYNDGCGESSNQTFMPFEEFESSAPKNSFMALNKKRGTVVIGEHKSQAVKNKSKKAKTDWSNGRYSPYEKGKIIAIWPARES